MGRGTVVNVIQLVLKNVVLCAALTVLLEVDVYAYADPGSGTLLLQLAAALLVGLMFYIRRITAWARRVFSTKSAIPSRAEPETDDKGHSSDLVEH
jgi:hypothetical protein